MMAHPKIIRSSRSQHAARLALDARTSARSYRPHHLPALYSRDMRSLPNSSVALLVRTDFADEQAWQLVCDEAAAVSADGFQANFVAVGDSSFDGASWETVKAAVPANDHGSMIVLIADAMTLRSPDRPILIVDLMDFQGKHLEPFRCVPSELWGVENNLNLANMDWEDFAGSADEHRIFRGF